MEPGQFGLNAYFIMVCENRPDRGKKKKMFVGQWDKMLFGTSNPLFYNTLWLRNFVPFLSQMGQNRKERETDYMRYGIWDMRCETVTRSVWQLSGFRSFRVFRG